MNGSYAPLLDLIFLTGMLLWSMLTAIGVMRRSPKILLWASVVGMVSSVVWLAGLGMCLFFVMAAQMLFALIMPRPNDPLYPPVREVSANISAEISVNALGQPERSVNETLRSAAVRDRPDHT